MVFLYGNRKLTKTYIFFQVFGTRFPNFKINPIKYFEKNVNNSHIKYYNKLIKHRH